MNEFINFISSNFKKDLLIIFILSLFYFAMFNFEIIFWTLKKKSKKSDLNQKNPI